MMFVCVFTTLSLSLSLVDFDRFRIVFLSTPKNMCIFTLTWMLLLRTLFLTSGQFNSLFISSSLADRQRVHHKKKRRKMHIRATFLYTYYNAQFLVHFRFCCCFLAFYHHFFISSSKFLLSTFSEFVSS